MRWPPLLLGEMLILEPGPDPPKLGMTVGWEYGNGDSRMPCPNSFSTHILSLYRYFLKKKKKATS